MLINVLIDLVIIGFLLWLVFTFIPMDGRIRQIAQAFVAVIVIIWVLSLLTGNAHPFSVYPLR